jgi:Fur family ferric uptake transcriptional regulator
MTTPNQAEALILQQGLRSTAVRVRVLAFLLAQQGAVTHLQVEMALSADEKVDRVTLYRTLDWLLDKNLAHKVIGADRAWCFRANVNDSAHQHHAHFKCQNCTKVICLDDVRSGGQTLALPAGYREMEVELTIKGLCAKCT